MVINVCNSSTQEARQEDCPEFKASLGKMQPSYLTPPAKKPPCTEEIVDARIFFIELGNNGFFLQYFYLLEILNIQVNVCSHILCPSIILSRGK